MYMENKDKQNEHYEIKMTIPNKEQITKFLEEMEPSSEQEKIFLYSIDSVSDFVDKLKTLSQEDEKALIKIFNPNISVPRNGNKKDFYITWLFLQQLDRHIVNTYRKTILKDMEEIFKLMKNMPKNRNEESFINYIKNLINKYARYSGNIN